MKKRTCLLSSIFILFDKLEKNCCCFFFFFFLWLGKFFLFLIYFLLYLVKKKKNFAFKIHISSPIKQTLLLLLLFMTIALLCECICVCVCVCLHLAVSVCFNKDHWNTDGVWSDACLLGWFIWDILASSVPYRIPTKSV